MLRTSIDLMKESSFKLVKERSRRDPAQTIMDVDYADDIALLANTPAQDKTFLHSLEWVADDIGLHVNIDKMEYMYFNQKGDISTLNGSSLKLVDKFIYQGSSISSTEKDINTRLAKAWTAIDRPSVILLLYGCTTWTLTKRMEKKLDSNYTRIPWAILNKSWRQYPTKQQLYGHLPPITKSIQVRRTRNVGHCWRSKDKLISDILLRTPSHGQAKAEQSARIHIQQLCAIIEYIFEDLPGAMDNRDG